MNKWIETKEELPKSSWDDYLILDINGYITAGWFSNGKFYHTNPGSDNIRECYPKRYKNIS